MPVWIAWSVLAAACLTAGVVLALQDPAHPLEGNPYLVGGATLAGQAILLRRRVSR